MRKRWAGGHISKGVYQIDRRRDGKRHKFSTKCTTLKGALVKLELFESGEDVGAAEDTAIEVAVAEYIEHSRVANGAKHVRMQMAGFLRWQEFGLESLDGIDAETGHLFIQWRANGYAGWRPPEVLTPVGAAAVNRDLAALKALCTWFRDTERKPEDWDPLKKVPLLKEHHDVRPHRVVPQDDVLAAREQLRPRWADALTVLYGSAFRWGSIARLNLPSVDRGRSVVRDPTPKGGRSVEVSVTPEVLAAALRCCGHSLPNDEAQQFGRRLATACRLAGVARFTAHDLRVSAASWMFAHGTSLKDIQAILGHASSRTTERYVRSTGGVARGPI